MFRHIQLIIPAATPKATPVTQRLKLTHGRIIKWWVGFPPGCVGLVHVVVYHYEHQILPAHEDEDLYWNNYVFEVPDYYDLTEEPYEIEVRAWNNDDIYQHTITVGVEVEEIEEETTESLLRRLLKTLVGE